MPVIAVLIATAFALIALFFLVRRHLTQPILWLMVAVGAFAFPITQWVARTFWERLAFTFAIPPDGAGLVVNVMALAFLAELFKFAPVLIVGAVTEAPADDWFAYGAAAGAGFGIFGAQLVIGGALALSSLPFSSPLTTGLAIIMRFFPLLGHIATTAFVCWAAPRGRLALGLTLAVLVQTILALAERGQGSLGVGLGGALVGLIALFLFVYVWTVRDRGTPHPARL